MPFRARVWNAGRLLLLVAGLVVTFFVFFLAAMRVAVRAREVAVPDLRGHSVSEATTALGAAGLVLKVDALRRPDPKVPVDHILRQDPEPGATVRKQRAIRVIVSDGVRAPVIPNILGALQRAAELSLADAHVAIAGIAEIRSARYEPDTVVSVDPPVKTQSSAVNLLVNRGQAAVTYVMPDLIGTPGLRVADLLRSLRFKVSESYVSYPGLASGIVVRQMPQPGYEVGLTDIITVEISR